MLRKERNGLIWYEFELLQNTPICHGSFTHQGGVSRGPFASLNAGFGVGDSQDNVRNNRKLLVETLCQDSKTVPEIISAHQVHSDRVEDISTLSKSQDGLVTIEKNKALLINHADCQAALFYDPKKELLAAVHAGWRGNVQAIYTKTIQLFTDTYHSSPQDILVCISPSLGPHHSEFKNYKQEFPEKFWQFQEKSTYFNLWDISMQELLEAGIVEKNIEIAKLCTYANPEEFFSYRRDKVTGRLATIAWMK